MQQDLSDFKFQYGLALSNSRVYIFTNSKNQILTISEKVGKFINGDTTDYVLFQIDYGNGIISNDYVYRKSEEFLNAYNKMNPSCRPGREGEVSGPILFLSSDASSYVQGQFIVVDGGGSSV